MQWGLIKRQNWSGASGFRSDITSINGFLETVRDRHILKVFLIWFNVARGFRLDSGEYS
jgi:hypothetical protein